MAALPQQRPTGMTATEYLEFERASEFRHEYVDGAIIAMSPTNCFHSLINASLIVALKTHLPDEYQSYAINMRVKVGEQTYVYPDQSIVCGEGQFEDNEFDTLLNPIVIIKVLSPVTETYDRGKKFQHYREIASLREYILITQDSPRIERFLRKDDGKWEPSDEKGLGASIELSSIGCTLALAEVYEQVDFSNDD